MKRLRPWHIVAIVCFAYIAITLARNDFDPKKFASIGSLYDPDVPGGETGYDGQFTYQIARDPINGWKKVDVPAYRYQRILYPIVARVLAVGRDDLIAWTLMAINVISLIAGTWLTGEILAHYGASRWYALAYGLNAGTLMSVRLDLTEPLAYGLAQAGVLLVLKDRSRWAALVLALAALTKETTLLFAMGVGVVYLLQRDWRKLVEFGLIVLTPFVLWQMVLLSWFGRFGVGSGGINADPFQIVPLQGLWSAATAFGVAFFVVYAATMLLLVVIPTLIALRVSIRNFLSGRADLTTIVLFLNAAVMLIVPRTTYQEPLATARFCVGLIVAMLMYAAAHGSKRGLNYALLWICTLALYEPVSVTGGGVVTLGCDLIVAVTMLIEWALNRRHARLKANLIG